MGKLADLQAANAALQQELKKLAAQVSQATALDDTVADLRQQIAEARKEITNLSANGPPSADVDKL
jgi:cell division septum initiation protein DivIVA